MARMAADHMRAERDASIRVAIKAKRPLDEIAEDFGMTFEQVQKIMVATHERR